MMTVELLRATAEPAELCGEAAGICTACDDRGRALRGALASGHESVIEHAVFTFRVTGVSRVLLAQLTRHRLASFSVESQRYVPMEEMPVVVPLSIQADETMARTYQGVMDVIRRFYRDAVAMGIPPEDARYITPQAAETKLIVTMNARELLHFFSLRLCARAQWEIRNMACEMLRLCREVAPDIFWNAGPGCVRGECPEGSRSCGHPWEKVKKRAKAQH